MRIQVRCAVLCALCAARTLGAGQPSPASPVERAVDALLAPHTSKVPGMSVAITEGGRIVYAKGFGSISLTAAVPATPDTQYRLASESKPFTSAGVFALVQDGKVALDDPARKYCGELSALDGAPTVRHLLVHQSGMRHTTDVEDVTIKGPVPRFGASLQKVVREKLLFTPGTKTQYTSWGYTALGCVIETASGQPYAEFMTSRVFVPASLNRTTFDRPDYESPAFSPGFRRGALSGFRPSIVVDTRFKTPASGLISTVNDLTRFAHAFLDGRIVADAFVKQMLVVDPGGEGRLRFTPAWTPAAGHRMDRRSISTDPWKARRRSSMSCRRGAMRWRSSQIASASYPSCFRSSERSAGACSNRLPPVSGSLWSIGGGVHMSRARHSWIQWKR